MNGDRDSRPACPQVPGLVAVAPQRVVPSHFRDEHRHASRFPPPGNRSPHSSPADLSPSATPRPPPGTPPSPSPIPTPAPFLLSPRPCPVGEWLSMADDSSRTLNAPLVPCPRRAGGVCDTRASPHRCSDVDSARQGRISTRACKSRHGCRLGSSLAVPSSQPPPSTGARGHGRSHNQSTNQLSPNQPPNPSTTTQSIGSQQTNKQTAIHLLLCRCFVVETPPAPPTCLVAMLFAGEGLGTG